MSLSCTSSPQQSRAQHRSQLSVSQATQPANARMSPASRYQSNLKVLRRRDPSIISIFDQFSHVCVYHHNGQKWEKQGYEGSMFLYERASYPPFGFYILNRVGMEDYIQRIFPEDDITTHGGYLMLRSYPNFTADRLEAISNRVNDNTNKFSNLYFYEPNGRTSKQKGESQTIGLWTFSSDGREPLSEVMLRLHSYIKQNQPYPDEYRYGPDRSPPPNPCIRTSSAASGRNEESDYSDPRPSAPTPVVSNTNGLSEVDQLFSKFLPKTQTTIAVPSTPTPAPAATTTASTLLSLIGTNQSSQSQSDGPPLPHSQNQTGKQLLEEIFASVGGNSQLQPAQQHTIPIHSTTPTTSALAPQVLNENTIGSLLGLASSHVPSVASPAFSAASSHPSSRDGDVEDDSLGSSSDRSPLRTDPAFKLLKVPTNGQGLSVNGDTTPRPPFTSIPKNLQNPQVSTKPRNGRALVPFEPNSELWPYPRQPLDEKSDLEEGEMVELDFSDMSALSDPEAFLRVQQQQSKKASKKEEKSKKKKKNRKERLEAIQKEKDAIEQSWDSPSAARTAVIASKAPVLAFGPDSPPASPSPQASPELTPSHIQTRGVTNGGNMTNGNKILPYKASQSLLASLAGQAPGQRPSAQERNTFVRELLTLIQTDKDFVDTLWTQYHNT